MPYYKNFTQVFEELKNLALENNLTVEDFADGTGADPQLIRILFNKETDVIDSISRMFEHVNIKLFTKHLVLKTYYITVSDAQIKVRRLIDPKCQIYYSKSEGRYYDFTYKHKKNRPSATREKIIQSEMKRLVDEYLINSYSSGYQNIIKNT